MLSLIFFVPKKKKKTHLQEDGLLGFGFKIGFDLRFRFCFQFLFHVYPGALLCAGEVLPQRAAGQRPTRAAVSRRPALGPGATEGRTAAAAVGRETC